jgi:OHCU decarboxylase
MNADDSDPKGWHNQASFKASPFRSARIGVNLRLLSLAAKSGVFHSFEGFPHPRAVEPRRRSSLTNTQFRSVDLDPSLESLNSLPATKAQSDFLTCCGSNEWAIRMTESRPFRDLNELRQTAESIWWSLAPEDWLEAFQHHPRLGESRPEQNTAAIAQEWSEQEQSGVRSAGKQTTEELSELNRKYQDKFGYIFVVCAAGKSSDQVLSILRERLRNDEQKELRIAATEQAQITKLRLEKLLNQ